MSTPSFSLHESATGRLERVRFVLVQPSHPGNVGACARALRTMGVRRLALVAPVLPDVLDQPETRARASGATDLLDAATIHPSLADALAGVSLAIAVSADMREFGPAPQIPALACAEAIAELAADPGHQVAFVFGPERTGLSIEDVRACQRLCSIPGEPDYHSLNLSQAAQIVAYALRCALADGRALPSPPVRHATAAQVDGLMAHLQRALVAVGFLDPAHPKKLMPRLARLFGRARLEHEEVELLRGVATMMERSAARAAAAGDGPARDLPAGGVATGDDPAAASR